MFSKNALQAGVLTFLQFLAGSGFSASVASQDEQSEWVLNGQSSVATSEQLVKQMTSTANGGDKKHKSFSILWPEAQLTAEGHPPLRVRLELMLDAGQTMIVGVNTPYPGLITKLSDARGTLVNLETGYTASLLLSERDSWIGKFMHSVVAHPNFISAEVPFSLYDAKTKSLIAENNLMIRFDLSDRANPKAVSALMSPTPTLDLYNQTTDIGKAMAGQTGTARLHETVLPEVYVAQATTSKASGISGRNLFTDLFSMDSLDLYQCGTGETMDLELHSTGFERDGRLITSPFSLRLETAPGMIDTVNQTAYLEYLSGELTLYQQDGPASFSIGPGNHGKVASRAFLKGSKVLFDLGIALRDQAGPPVIARLRIACSKKDSTCRSIRLSTASDALGRVASKRTLSTQLEKNHSQSLGVYKAPFGESKVGFRVPKPGCNTAFCPTCVTSGNCGLQGVCAEAPISCTPIGCPHIEGESRCCRGGFSRLCCKNCGGT